MIACLRLGAGDNSHASNEKAAGDDAVVRSKQAILIL
jgi:hypothetical protein